MSFKAATSLAFRLLSVYFAFVAIQYASMTARMVTPAMRFANIRNQPPPWPNFAVPAFLYIVGGALLYWYSVRTAPKSDEDMQPVSYDQLKSLLFMVLGAFFLINYAPLAVADVFSTFRDDFFNRQTGLDRWLTDFGSSLAGLALIVFNAPKREAIPGFDEMTKDTRRSRMF